MSRSRDLGGGASAGGDARTHIGRAGWRDRVVSWGAANPVTVDRLLIAGGAILGAVAGLQRIYGEPLGFDSLAVVAGTTLTVGGLLYWSRRRARARVEQTNRALADQRLRIARELHDVVAHHVSVMGIQAAGARRLVETRGPDEALTVARDALSSIETSSRTAVLELHRLLGMLRAAGTADGAAETARLSDIPTLAENARRAGVSVDVAVTGSPPAGGLPPTLDRSAYRIVQEALTNVIRHAGRGAKADVAIRYTSSSLELVIADAGSAAGAPGLVGAGSGHGLVGMRERVALFGGEFSAGPRPEGGFMVRAVLPFGVQVAG